MSAPRRIAIIGAGPAGCMLARLLHLASIPVTVFESEESPNYRSQGGTLDLHTDTGLAALKAAGLYEGFLKQARFDGESLLITDRNLKTYFQIKPTKESESKIGGQRPEIDRAELRRLLTESLPEGTIQWGHHLKEVKEDGTLVFRHTTVSGFDLVVGADGAWSKVRAALSEQKPIYSGVAMHDFSIPDAATTAPDVYEVVNRGSIFACGDGHRVALQQMGDGSIHVTVSFIRNSDNWAETSSYDVSSAQSVKDALFGDGGEYEDWHPTIKAAISKSSDSCGHRSLYMLPVGFSWEHRRPFTVIGDAAHLMTPFAGEGVNVALEDALQLSRTIVDAVSAVKMDSQKNLGDELDQAVAAFEKEMFARAARVAELTDEMRKAYYFTEGVPKSIIARTTTLHAKFHTPPILHPLVTAGVRGYFFWKGLFQ
ncbi:putative tetracycline resistance protein from transposon protein [Phaeoacremonium minimum UCRPA7]|uniref:Putative tetracycline resistance protein from transposon protein n=1 Tax=Phaeoacremonium minimum (strain UCR-PA7) TaxID=1286976 RepID=R8BR91_PHAM7|nr:putative tetracycline resistance protein from transposon protein [Phaeoacremonium minimum UCRPA7]EOO01888.1 putative tetracycline resistance protein from transposon protein [Phaeoacremonium minimum UCRPA7]